jgi:polar amino acid transport system substrate-binding protein
VSLIGSRRRIVAAASVSLALVVLASACSSSSSSSSAGSPSAAASSAPAAVSSAPAAASSSAPAAASSAPAAASSAAPASSAAAAPAASGSIDTSTLGLKTPGVLNLAADFTASPNQFINNGKNDGFDVALCQGMAAKMGLTLKWTNLGFDGLIPGLQANRYDGLCTAIFITKAREQVMNMVPYVQWGDTMAVKNSVAASYSCAGSTSPCWSKFAGKKVATTSGGAEVTYLQNENKTLSPKMTILQFASNVQVYQALANGSVDASYVDDPQFAYFNKTQGDNAYTPIFTGVAATALAVTTLKSNTALAQAFVTALNEMKADGSYQAILKQWGVEAVDSFTINPTASS